MSYQPYTLSTTAWEHTTYEQRYQAFLQALDMALDMALQGDATVEAVVEEADWIPEPWAHPATWGVRAEPWDSGMSDAPIALRLGCGCLGLLLKPLFWLRIAKEVPVYKVRGPLSSSLAEHLRRATEARLVVSMRLEQAGRSLLECYDYGEHWLVWFPPGDLESLCRQLSNLLKIPHPLEPLPQP